MPDDQLAEDVSAASAAVLFNLLPSILDNPAAEIYHRLAEHIRAAIQTYADGLTGWTLEPSVN